MRLSEEASAVELAHHRSRVDAVMHCTNIINKKSNDWEEFYVFKTMKASSEPHKYTENYTVEL